MFYNVGRKIKIVAQAITWIGIIISCVVGFNVISSDENAQIRGILIIAIGCLVSWLSSLTLYGFGQLIENSDILVQQSINKPNYTYDADTPNVSTPCDKETHKKYKERLCNNVGANTKDGHWEIDPVLNEKVFVCNHCHGVIAFETDFVKDEKTSE